MRLHEVGEVAHRRVADVVVHRRAVGALVEVLRHGMVVPPPNARAWVANR